MLYTNRQNYFLNSTYNMHIYWLLTPTLPYRFHLTISTNQIFSNPWVQPSLPHRSYTCYIRDFLERYVVNNRKEETGHTFISNGLHIVKYYYMICLHRGVTVPCETFVLDPIFSRVRDYTWSLYWIYWILITQNNKYLRYWLSYTIYKLLRYALPPSSLWLHGLY
jgi:hypothetical protein